MEQVASNEVITFEAKTLDEVYEKASHSLNCSITDLEIVIKQAPSKGFLGLFSKNAIINVQMKSIETEVPSSSTHNNHENPKIETLASRLNALNSQKNEKQKIPAMTKQAGKENLFDEFYTENEEIHFEPQFRSSQSELSDKIALEVNNLFSKLSYDIDNIRVEIIDEDKIVYIEFSGKDSALLIGKEGYRYKALSYVLFNWINEKYGMMLRLEIAQFLENQEKAIFTYLEPVIKTIKAEGFFKTKVLDGILVHIALTKLRDEFPDKYVAVKTTQRGEKYILVNEYRN